MPFVYVFGRADFTISYFGANVFPENVTVGLEQAPIDAWVTGKFVMQAREDDDRNRYLSIVVELGPGIEPDQAKADAIAESILRHLLRLNSEFANYVPAERQRPRIELAPQGRPRLLPDRRQTPLHAALVGLAAVGVGFTPAPVGLGGDLFWSKAPRQDPALHCEHPLYLAEQVDVAPSARQWNRRDGLLEQRAVGRRRVPAMQPGDLMARGAAQGELRPAADDTSRYATPGTGSARAPSMFRLAGAALSSPKNRCQSASGSRKILPRGPTPLTRVAQPEPRRPSRAGPCTPCTTMLSSSSLVRRSKSRIE